MDAVLRDENRAFRTRGIVSNEILVFTAHRDEPAIAEGHVVKWTGFTHRLCRPMNAVRGRGNDIFAHGDEDTVAVGYAGEITDQWTEHPVGSIRSRGGPAVVANGDERAIAV